MDEGQGIGELFARGQLGELLSKLGCQGCVPKVSKCQRVTFGRSRGAKVSKAGTWGGIRGGGARNLGEFWGDEVVLGVG